MGKSATANGKKGGNLVGSPHYDKSGNPAGGIKAVVTDANGKPVELEGGEVIINKAASKKHWKTLSKINQSAGGGVPIGPPQDPHDEDPQDYEDGGTVIEFNPNHIPNKWVVKYAETIKKNHPEIWKLGGSVYGNEAFENLLRVSKRGHWLDSEAWMYIKWRTYVARHKKDSKIAGVVAMLKWADKIDKGWAYMKDLIDETIAKKSKKSGWKTKKPARMSKSEELKKGTELELDEHKDTIDKIKRKGVSSKKVAKSIAKDHLKEDSHYYTKLADLEASFGKGGTTPQQEQKIRTVIGEFKAGTLHSGSKDGPIVTNEKQAIAIALSEAGVNNGKAHKMEPGGNVPLYDVGMTGIRKSRSKELHVMITAITTNAIKYQEIDSGKKHRDEIEKFQRNFTPDPEQSPATVEPEDEIGTEYNSLDEALMTRPFIMEMSEGLVRANVAVDSFADLERLVTIAGFTDKPTETYVKNYIYIPQDDGSNYRIRIDSSKKDGDYNFEKTNLASFIQILEPSRWDSYGRWVEKQTSGKPKAWAAKDDIVVNTTTQLKAKVTNVKWSRDNWSYTLEWIDVNNTGIWEEAELKAQWEKENPKSQPKFQNEWYKIFKDKKFTQVIKGGEYALVTLVKSKTKTGEFILGFLSTKDGVTTTEYFNNEDLEKLNQNSSANGWVLKEPSTSTKKQSTAAEWFKAFKDGNFEKGSKKGTWTLEKIEKEDGVFALTLGNTTLSTAGIKVLDIIGFTQEELELLDTGNVVSNWIYLSTVQTSTKSKTAPSTAKEWSKKLNSKLIRFSREKTGMYEVGIITSIEKTKAKKELFTVKLEALFVRDAMTSLTGNFTEEDLMQLDSGLTASDASNKRNFKLLPESVAYNFNDYSLFALNMMVSNQMSQAKGEFSIADSKFLSNTYEKTLIAMINDFPHIEQPSDIQWGKFWELTQEKFPMLEEFEEWVNKQIKLKKQSEPNKKKLSLLYKYFLINNVGYRESLPKGTLLWSSSQKSVFKVKEVRIEYQEALGIDEVQPIYVLRINEVDSDGAANSNEHEEKFFQKEFINLSKGKGAETWDAMPEKYRLFNPVSTKPEPTKPEPTAPIPPQPKAAKREPFNKDLDYEELFTGYLKDTATIVDTVSHDNFVEGIAVSYADVLIDLEGKSEITKKLNAFRA